MSDKLLSAKHCVVHNTDLNEDVSSRQRLESSSGRKTVEGAGDGGLSSCCFLMVLCGAPSWSGGKLVRLGRG